MKTRIKIRIQKLTYVSRELYFQLTKLKLIKNKKFEWRRKKLESRLPQKNESRDRKRKSNVTFRFHIWWRRVAYQTMMFFLSLATLEYSGKQLNSSVFLIYFGVFGSSTGWIQKEAVGVVGGVSWRLVHAPRFPIKFCRWFNPPSSLYKLSSVTFFSKWYFAKWLNRSSK